MSTIVNWFRNRRAQRSAAALDARQGATGGTGGTLNAGALNDMERRRRSELSSRSGRASTRLASAPGTASYTNSTLGGI